VINKQCNVGLTLPMFNDTVCCFVTTLPNAFQVLLGQDWLKLREGGMDFWDIRCLLRKGNRTYTLGQSMRLP
jgi:hypothetical protein